MDNFKRLLIYWSLFLSAALLIQADPRLDDTNDEFDNENLIEYSYRYAVDESKSQGPVMDRWEQRIGEYVKGAYSVVDPDGRVRTVDYEVDGKKGYHAVIRMNEPGPDLLSYQQLSKSIELFPEASLPTPSDIPVLPSRNLSPPDPSSGKAWNYHSNTPYVNQPGVRGDYKAASTNQITKTALIRSLQSLPYSPANYNVPQTAKLIYFKTPAGAIYPQTFLPLNSGFSEANKKEGLIPIFVPAEDNSLPRRRRNSKLVKRYKSFSEVES